MDNKKIANILNNIADYLEMDEVDYKPQAYRKAARGIYALDEPAENIYKKEELSGLQKISGVGESIAEKIEEFIKTGELEYYQDLREKAPVDLADLTGVEGVGPKTVKKLYEKLGVESLEDLERVARKGRIQNIEGFGEKSEEDILQGVEFYKKSHERFLLGFIQPFIEEVKEKVASQKEINKVEIAGSYRRRKETIGDIDILVTSTAPEKTAEFFIKMEEVVHTYNQGETKCSVRLSNDMDCDLRIVEKDSYGAALQYFTGSKSHNIEIRKIAQSRDWKLNEYGIFNADGKKLAGKTEKEVYNELDLPYIAPELRTNRGEIDAAKKNGLPDLIKAEDIKGDLQMHSTYSDGSHSVAQMAKAAKDLGHEYIAITDHSQSLGVAGGLKPEELKEQWGEIEKVNREIDDIRILKGAEVDILKDGTLDYPNEILKKFDLALGAIHSQFNLSKTAQTKRLLSAMESPYIDIIAHPTGRVLQQRKGYELDMEKIFKKAAETGTILEINSYPDRLDLDDIHIKKALEHDIKLSTNTDSHHKNHLAYIEFGVAQARRGWAEKSDIINTLSVDEMLEALPRNNS